MSGNQFSRNIFKGLRKETKQKHKLSPLELFKKSRSFPQVRRAVGKAADRAHLSPKMEGLEVEHQGQLETWDQPILQFLHPPLQISIFSLWSKRGVWNFSCTEKRRNCGMIGRF